MGEPAQSRQLINSGSPSPSIVACINVYQDGEWLEKCLYSLLHPIKKVDKIVVVDGAYQGFPHDKAWSTDDTIKIAEALADVIVIPKEVWPDEIVKRNFYLRYVPNGFWWLRIDADEELIGDFSEFTPRTEELVYCLNISRPDTPGVGPMPIHALFKRGPDSRYYGTHHAVWYNGQLLTKLEPEKECPTYSGANLLHHTGERRKERVEAKGTYYRESLTPDEREFRAKWEL